MRLLYLFVLLCMFIVHAAFVRIKSMCLRLRFSMLADTARVTNVRIIIIIIMVIELDAE